MVRPRLHGGAWGAPHPVELTGGWPYDARQPSVTVDGSLYFSSDAPGGSGERDLYAAAHLSPGRWSVTVGAPINSEHDGHGAFVAPDGSYMILTSSRPRPDRQGDDDLWVSFPTGEGWSNPIPLPLPVNTFANEYGRWVSPVDGRLYFTSDRYGFAAVFRVDADVIGVAPAGPSDRGRGDGPRADRNRTRGARMGPERRQHVVAWLLLASLLVISGCATDAADRAGAGAEPTPGEMVPGPGDAPWLMPPPARGPRPRPAAGRRPLPPRRIYLALAGGAMLL